MSYTSFDRTTRSKTGTLSAPQQPFSPSRDDHQKKTKATTDANAETFQREEATAHSSSGVQPPKDERAPASRKLKTLAPHRQSRLQFNKHQKRVLQHKLKKTATVNYNMLMEQHSQITELLSLLKLQQPAAPQACSIFHQLCKDKFLGGESFDIAHAVRDPSDSRFLLNPLVVVLGLSERYLSYSDIVQPLSNIPGTFSRTWELAAARRQIDPAIICEVVDLFINLAHIIGFAEANNDVTYGIWSHFTRDGQTVDDEVHAQAVIRAITPSMNRLQDIFGDLAKEAHFSGYEELFDNATAINPHDLPAQYRKFASSLQQKYLGYRQANKRKVVGPSVGPSPSANHSVAKGKVPKVKCPKCKKHFPKAKFETHKVDCKGFSQ